MRPYRTILAVSAIVCMHIPLHSQTGAEPSALPMQPSSVASIIANEHSIPRAKELTALAEDMDAIYGSIYQNALAGKKLVIFIDPAHGMVSDGSGKQWQGALTWRKSTTGVPEELYSIPICRRLYKTLTANPFLDVTSTPDFLEVMKGNAEVYDDVSFDTSVALAKKSARFVAPP